MLTPIYNIFCYILLLSGSLAYFLLYIQWCWVFSFKGFMSCNPLSDDLTIIYDYSNGALPPPYHYEYTIQLGSGVCGRVRYQSGYSDGQTPILEETFPVERYDLDLVYKMMLENDVFRNRWQMEESRVGGSTSSMEVRMNDKVYSIPADAELTDRDLNSLDEIFQAIKMLVPAEFWNRCEDQQNRCGLSHSK
jgi:hypothetical protein